MSTTETYSINIAGVQRDLRLFEIKPGVRIAVLNILGDTELVAAASKALAGIIAANPPDLFVTAEAKSIPLAYALSYEMNIPYIVLRKTHKPYMGEAVSAETLSITTGKPQMLYIDEKDIATAHGKKVMLVDDVISTGSTLQGMRLLMNKAGAEVMGEAAILTEGDRAQWHEIISLGHLPVWVD